MKAKLNVQLFFPSALKWMWNYCIYLGPFTHEGENYDLGVFVDENSALGVSAAIVYGDNPGQYLSGHLKYFNESPVYVETIKRAKALGLLGATRQYFG